MGLGRFIHHIGTFLLLVSTVCLIVVSITAPVINSLSILKVNLDDSTQGSGVTFGTFGYCILDGGSDGHDSCTKSKIGYNPTNVLQSLDSSTDFSDAAEDTTKALTRVMVLHPVACGLSFIAFLICVGAGIVGSLVASIVSAFTFVVTIVVLATDFVLFGIIKRKVNDIGGDVHAHWREGIWLVVVAAICNLIAAVLVFVSCCSGRRERRRTQTTKMSTYHE